MSPSSLTATTSGPGTLTIDLGKPDPYSLLDVAVTDVTGSGAATSVKNVTDTYGNGWALGARASGGQRVESEQWFSSQGGLAYVDQASAATGSSASAGTGTSASTTHSGDLVIGDLGLIQTSITPASGFASYPAVNSNATNGNITEQGGYETQVPFGAGYGYSGSLGSTKNWAGTLLAIAPVVDVLDGSSCAGINGGLSDALPCINGAMQTVQSTYELGGSPPASKYPQHPNNRAVPNFVYLPAGTYLVGASSCSLRGQQVVQVNQGVPAGSSNNPVFLLGSGHTPGGSATTEIREESAAVCKLVFIQADYTVVDNVYINGGLSSSGAPCTPGDVTSLCGAFASYFTTGNYETLENVQADGGNQDIDVNFYGPATGGAPCDNIEGHCSFGNTVKNGTVNALQNGFNGSVAMSYQAGATIDHVTAGGDYIAVFRSLDTNAGKITQVTNDTAVVGLDTGQHPSWETASDVNIVGISVPSSSQVSAGYLEQCNPCKKAPPPTAVSITSESASGANPLRIGDVELSTGLTVKTSLLPNVIVDPYIKACGSFDSSTVANMGAVTCNPVGLAIADITPSVCVVTGMATC